MDDAANLWAAWWSGGELYGGRPGTTPHDRTVTIIFLIASLMGTAALRAHTTTQDSDNFDWGRRNPKAAYSTASVLALGSSLDLVDHRDSAHEARSLALSHSHLSYPIGIAELNWQKQEESTAAWRVHVKHDEAGR